MTKKLIKTKTRVQKHGEVFTPKWIVHEMLEIPCVKEACNDLNATFLEPSAGEGNFLMEILRKKLDMVGEKYIDSLAKYENYSLFALTTIYGIELLEDNAQRCVINLYEVYKEKYLSIAETFNKEVKTNVLDSAKLIISKNIAQGNSLTKLSPDGKPIVFSEWKAVNKLKKETSSIKVLRTEYTLEDIIEGKTNESGSLAKAPKVIVQLDFFSSYDSDFFEPQIENSRYVPVKITEVYNEEIERD